MPNSANSAGYSGTPLWKKLGLKNGMRALRLGAPDDYDDLIAGGPYVDWDPNVGELDFAHVFATDRSILSGHIEDLRHKIAPNGMIWASWPKKASKVPTDITEDTIRSIALPIGLVDVKVCAVDATWSGLKLVIRKELR